MRLDLNLITNPRVALYIVQDNVSDDKYVGSATDFERRFGNHYSSIRDLYDDSTKGAKFHKTLFANGIENYSALRAPLKQFLILILTS